MNIQATPEQIVLAKKRFLERTKPYFELLNKIYEMKTPTVIFDIESGVFTIDYEKETQLEKELKSNILDIRLKEMENLIQ